MQATPSNLGSPITRGMHQTKIILEMIKFEHTVFMLPFALMATVLAAHGDWALLWRKLPWVLVAMVGARSAAMAFNRIVDARYDALNPRTAKRALPAGLLTVPQVVAFTVVAAALLVWAAAMLNPLALALSPVALVLALGYSYTKRFTPFSHFFLGLALAVAPVGAWIAVTGRIDPPALWLGGAVVCWLFGFDTIYALQDTEFDRANGLRSLPAWLGNARALVVSRLVHALMIGLLVMVGLSAHLGPIYYVAVGLVALLITYEQSLVKHDDLSRLDVAFFTLNGYISVGLFVLTLADVLIGGSVAHAASLPPAPKAAARYAVTDLGTLPGYSASEAQAINNRGQVVGTAYFRGPFQVKADKWRAFRWEGGKRHDLGALPGYANSAACGINDRGDIVGYCTNKGHGDRNPLVVWRDGALRALGVTDHNLTPVCAINNRGQVAGSTLFHSAGAPQTAFLWRGGPPRALGTLHPGAYSMAAALNNAAPPLVVGNSYERSFVWSDGKMKPLATLGGGSCQPRAINDRGDIVGWAELRHPNLTHACLWRKGAATDLGALSQGGQSIAEAVNNRGVVVGNANADAPSQLDHAFLWQDGKMTDLNRELPTDSSVILVSANGINDHGQIICDGFPANEGNNEHQHAFLLTPARAR